MQTAIKQDSGTILTLNYLNAIEARLSVTWESENVPICLPDQFDATNLKSLKVELDDILKCMLK